MWERGRSSDSGLPLPPPSRPGASGVVAESISPYSGGTVPDSHRVPSPCSCSGGRAYHRTVSGPFVRRWLPVLAWAAVIFAFSSVPDLGTGLGGWDLVLRKIAHAGEYAVLGALLARATGRPWLAAALGVLYAVSDEVHQAFVPGRAGSPLDVAIDGVGVVCGVLVWQHVARRWRLA
jgi:VanZ like family